MAQLVKNTSTGTYTGEGASARRFVFGYNLHSRPFGHLVYVWPLVVTLGRREELLLFPTKPLTYRPWRLLASHVPFAAYARTGRAVFSRQP